MYMLMDYTIYINNVCLNLQKFLVVEYTYFYTRVHRNIEATVYSDYSREGEQWTSLTNMLLNPRIFGPEATRNSLRDWKVKNLPGEHSPISPLPLLVKEVNELYNIPCYTTKKAFEVIT